MNKSLLVLAGLFLSINVGFSLDTITCSWDYGACNGQNEHSIFYISNLTDSQGYVLNSPVESSEEKGFNKQLCCSTSNDQLDFSTVSSPDTCDYTSFMYISNDKNHRLAFNSSDPEFSFAKYTSTLCVKKPPITSDFFDIQLARTDSSYGDKGYQCLFRVSSDINGLVSDCNATFNGNQMYDYTVWSRFFEASGDLDCNLDCTSRSDSRVYRACGQLVPECSAVPSECDGSLLGAWVDYGLDKEIQCSDPWIKTREKRNLESLNVISTSNDCPNLISNSYTVLLNNEPVTMKVYICSQ